MDFALSDEQAAIRDLAGQLAHRDQVLLAARGDREGRGRLELLARADLGLGLLELGVDVLGEDHLLGGGHGLALDEEGHALLAARVAGLALVAAADDAGQLEGQLEARLVSGSVLHGDRCDGAEGFLGRFHQQLSVLGEGRQRELLGWLAPGAKAFSVLPTFLSSLLPRRPLGLDTNLHGGRRAMVPIGSFERVMPLDLLPTPLLKALLVEDTERAKELGCLELDEEDLSLCSFVCNGKYEYGPFLRMTLDEIEANG